jgi:hypothetical protein
LLELGINPISRSEGEGMMVLVIAWLASVAVVLDLVYRAPVLDGMD